MQYSVDSCISAVATHRNIPVALLKSVRRTKPISSARQEAFYLLRVLTDLSLGEIGSLFGGRDHTTVAHGIQRVMRCRQNNPDYVRQVEDIKRRIQLKAGVFVFDYSLPPHISVSPTLSSALLENLKMMAIPEGTSQ